MVSTAVVSPAVATLLVVDDAGAAPRVDATVVSTGSPPVVLGAAVLAVVGLQRPGHSRRKSAVTRICIRLPALPSSSSGPKQKLARAGRHGEFCVVARVVPGVARVVVGGVATGAGAQPPQVKGQSRCIPGRKGSTSHRNLSWRHFSGSVSSSAHGAAVVVVVVVVVVVGGMPVAVVVLLVLLVGAAVGAGAAHMPHSTGHVVRKTLPMLPPNAHSGRMLDWHLAWLSLSLLHGELAPAGVAPARSARSARLPARRVALAIAAGGSTSTVAAARGRAARRLACRGTSGFPPR